MAEVYLLIGGNMGNRSSNLNEARVSINSEAGTLLKCSSLYETAAWGITDQPAFLNQALFLQTNLAPANLLEVLLAIEIKLGRRRMQKFGPRTIDIDILFYDNEVITTNNLTLPHPEIQNRRFALVPLNEIAPRFVHPVLDQPIEELLQHCPDQLPVNLVTDENA